MNAQSLREIVVCPLLVTIGHLRLHALKGDLKHHWSVSVSGNWRLTFKFEGEDAILVDYQDYH